MASPIRRWSPPSPRCTRPHAVLLSAAEKAAFAGNCHRPVGRPGLDERRRRRQALSPSHRGPAGGRRLRRCAAVPLDEIEKAGGSLRCCVGGDLLSRRRAQAEHRIHCPASSDGFTAMQHWLHNPFLPRYHPGTCSASRVRCRSLLLAVLLRRRGQRLRAAPRLGRSPSRSRRLPTATGRSVPVQGTAARCPTRVRRVERQTGGEVLRAERDAARWPRGQPDQGARRPMAASGSPWTIRSRRSRTAAPDRKQ